MVVRLRLSCICSWEEKHVFISWCEKKHFGELWIAVSYFASKVIVEWCSAKVSVLQKAILKCSFSESLFKIFEKYHSMKDVFLSIVADVKPVTLSKNDFFHTLMRKKAAKPAILKDST